MDIDSVASDSVDGMMAGKTQESEQTDYLEDQELPEMSLALSDDDELGQEDTTTTTTTMKSPKEKVQRKRLIVDDEDSEDEAPKSTLPDSEPEDGDQLGDVSIRRNNRIVDDDSDEEDDDKEEKDDQSGKKKKVPSIDDSEEEEENDQLNSSKKVMKNLKSLCDDESSEEDEDEDEDNNEKEETLKPNKGVMDSSDEDDSNSGVDEEEGGSTTTKEKRPKNLSRKAKTEAENVISMIQKNAREDELTVPYHCPEQKSLKDFLESLKSSKAKLIEEEKVEIKTHKFKLLKDIPKPEVVPEKKQEIEEEETDKPEESVPLEGTEAAEPVKEGESTVEIPKETPKESPKEPSAAFIPKLSGAGPKLTLKGDPNTFIDLETGNTLVKKTAADTMISKLMKHSRSGHHNDPKFRPEPIPGAAKKQLHQTLEREIKQKRAEHIQKIIKVEADEKAEEEELLSDDEYELDSDDETKKRKMKKKPVKDEAEKKNQTIFNEDEEEMEFVEGDDDEGAGPDAEDGADGDAGDEEDGEEEEEEDEESDSDGDELDTSEAPGKRSLKRIVAMDDSDEEGDKPEDKSPIQEPTETSEETPSQSAPILDDIPTEPLREFDFSTTQNDNELFDLCSGKFQTQLPIMDDCSQAPEASQVRDFAGQNLTPFSQMEGFGGSTEGEQIVEDPVVKEKELDRDEEVEPVAGPHGKALLSSSDEDENADGPDSELKQQKKKKELKKRKKKRLVIEEDDEDDLPNAPAGDSGSEEELGEEEEEEGDEVDQEALPEELQEYKSFLSGKPPKEDQRKRMKASEFFEKEAELSDSEWGSEDEDERGLDALEDIGLVKDDEDFDGEQLRDEVGRIHMRQMANEDNRELKYLKDLILNEEETDGQGRQRTFRWQNLNNDQDQEDVNGSVKVGEGAEAQGEAAESDDEENEANWRKIRIEREKALQENTENANANVTITTKFDAMMRQSRDIRVVKPNAVGDMQLKENSSPSFLMTEQSKKYMNLRQSFLLRDEETLNRLATISAKADGGSTAADGKQNFVFRRVEDNKTANVSAADAEAPKKRKSNGINGMDWGTPPNPQAKKRKV